MTGQFSGYFTKAMYLRSQAADELERRLGYGAGRLGQGWWLLFATELPAPSNFHYGGYTHFSDSRIGHPSRGKTRETVEESLAQTMGGLDRVDASKPSAIAKLKVTGFERLAKVIPVATGDEYPVGTGIYQCTIPKPIRCVVAAFIPPGETYLGMYI